MGMVIRNDAISLAGIEYQTPSNCQNNGNTKAIGNNMNNCLDSERNIEILTFPMLWKK